MANRLTFVRHFAGSAPQPFGNLTPLERRSKPRFQANLVHAKESRAGGGNRTYESLACVAAFVDGESCKQSEMTVLKMANSFSRTAAV